MKVTVVFWLVALLVFLVIEAVTAGLTSIWFAFGALAGLICAVTDGPEWLQGLWFLIISAAALVITRPLAKKFINARTVPTNADRVLGRVAVVTETIDNTLGSGCVRVDGQEWTARSLDESVIPAGKTVIAREIRGVKLIVEETKE